MATVALNVEVNINMLDDWKGVTSPIFRDGGNEKLRIVIALRSTVKLDRFIENMIFRYIRDSRFRARIDSYINANEENGLPRLIAATAQQGYLDETTYSWRREILSTICDIYENKDDGYDVITCAKQSERDLRIMMAPFE